MFTLSRLTDNIANLRSYGFHKANKPSIQKVSPIPFKKQLILQAEVASMPVLNADGSINVKATALKDPSYLTTIVFHKVGFNDIKTSKFNTGIAVLPGLNMYLEKPSFTHSPVKVSCTCPDYAYTFSYFNGVNGVNNTPLKYPSGFKHILPKGIRNPTQTISMCKHIHALAELLYKERTIRI